MFYVTANIEQALDSKDTHPLTRHFIEDALDASTFLDAEKSLEEALKLIKERNQKLCPHLRNKGDK